MKWQCSEYPRVLKVNNSNDCMRLYVSKLWYAKQLPNPLRYTLYNSTKDTDQKLFYMQGPRHLKGPLVMEICGHWNSRTGNRQIINLTIMKYEVMKLIIILKIMK